MTIFPLNDRPFSQELIFNHCIRVKKGLACGLTICVDAHYEVISHGFGLPQLVGVTVVHHVITMEMERGDTSSQWKTMDTLRAQTNE